MGDLSPIEDDDGGCTATTAAGTRCSRAARFGADVCAQHASGKTPQRTNGPNVTHGRRSTYARGCRCKACSLAGVAPDALARMINKPMDVWDRIDRYAELIAEQEAATLDPPSVRLWRPPAKVCREVTRVATKNPEVIAYVNNAILAVVRGWDQPGEDATT